MDEKDVLPRIGTFFLIMGAGSVFLFVISDMAKDAVFNYLFVGLFLIGIGIAFRRNAKKPETSGRFAMWKKMSSKEKKDKKEKK